MDPPQPTNSRRSAKRSRLSEGGSYRDVVPIAGDEGRESVLVSEGRLRKVGFQYRPAPLERVPQRLADAWEDVREWEPADSFDYALDADGEKYDEVVEGSVMAEQPAVKKPKRKKSKVSVSFLAYF